MAKKQKINFNITPKFPWVSDDTMSYDDFVASWTECHDNDEEPPAEGSAEFFNVLAEEHDMMWNIFKDKFENCHLIGKTCLFIGKYISNYPDFQPSGNRGRVIKIDSLNDFMMFTCGHPDKVDIWSDKNGLHVQNDTHDGTITLVVKTLTKKGEEYWERMCRKGAGQTMECHRHLDETKGLSSSINYYIF